MTADPLSRAPHDATRTRRKRIKRPIPGWPTPASGSHPAAGVPLGSEAFWSRMQVELLDSRRWKTRVELANAIFEYIEVFHNRWRRHSSLGMLTPIEFELNNMTSQPRQPESRNATPPNRGYCEVSTKPGDPTTTTRSRRCFAPAGER